MSNEISNWVHEVIPQIAAMGGKPEILGDSPAEVSIMKRFMEANATPQEKDFMQKFLDGEPLAQPQEPNTERKLVRTDMANSSQTSEYGREIGLDSEETYYDENGNWTHDISKDKSGNIIQEEFNIVDKETGNTTYRSKDASGTFVEQVTDKDGNQVYGYMVDKMEDGTYLYTFVDAELNMFEVKYDPKNPSEELNIGVDDGGSGFTLGILEYVDEVIYNDPAKVRSGFEEK